MARQVAASTTGNPGKRRKIGSRQNGWLGRRSALRRSSPVPRPTSRWTTSNVRRLSGRNRMDREVGIKWHSMHNLIVFSPQFSSVESRQARKRTCCAGTAISSTSCFQSRAVAPNTCRFLLMQKGEAGSAGMQEALPGNRPVASRISGRSTLRGVRIYKVSAGASSSVLGVKAICLRKLYGSNDTQSNFAQSI